MSEFTSVTQPPETEGKQSQLRRRGLIAGAAAFVAGLVAKDALAPDRAAAAGPLTIDVTNTGAALTWLQATSGASPSFRVSNNYTSTTFDSTADAIQGYAAGANNSGALARNDDLNGVGMYGIATNGTGLAGQSVGGSAVSGSSISGSGGYFTTTSGSGVTSISSSGAAVFGTSGTGYGVYGAISGNGLAALYGTSSAHDSAAFQAQNTVPGGLAGNFTGSVAVNGNFVVYGSGAIKSAAVPHPDGSMRLLYCVESPESWFEDFGEGTITAGQAEVKLDADFTAVVDTGKLHVFLTPHDADHHLAVTTRTGAGFNVGVGISGEAVARGVKASSATGTFTYRVVAKRKDVPGGRLAKFTPPKVSPALKTVPSKVVPLPGRRVDGPTKG